MKILFSSFVAFVSLLLSVFFIMRDCKRGRRGKYELIFLCSGYVIIILFDIWLILHNFKVF